MPCRARKTGRRECFQELYFTRTLWGPEATAANATHPAPATKFDTASGGLEQYCSVEAYASNQVRLFTGF
jgi:hypothetical protein